MMKGLILSIAFLKDLHDHGRTSIKDMKHLFILFSIYIFNIFLNPLYSLEIMTFNIQKGGVKNKREIIKIIKKSKAEIIGINEAYDEETFKKIALDLGYYFYRSTTKKYQVGILSKYPIIDQETLKNPIFSRSIIRVKIKISNKEILTVFVIHLKPLNLPSSRKKRHLEILKVLNHIEKINEKEPIILMGDFNERSHLDKPHKKKFVSKILAKKGFIDAFRKINPSIKDAPGYTQSVKTFLIKRIDFIYCNKTIDITAAKNLGESFFNNWPSDHAAVLATINLK